MSKIVLAQQSTAPDTPGSGKVAIFVDTNGDLAWKDDAGNVVKIVASGGYTLTIPATGKAALSAYGSWTPALKFGGASTGLTTSALFGDYTILSNGNTANPLGFCVARFVIALSALGSSTGNATITGLPFTSGTQIGGATMYYATGLASITTAPFGSIAAAATTIILWQWGSTGMAVLTHANFTNSSVLQGYAYYYTATL